MRAGGKHAHRSWAETASQGADGQLPVAGEPAHRHRRPHAAAARSACTVSTLPTPPLTLDQVGLLRLSGGAGARALRHVQVLGLAHHHAGAGLAGGRLEGGGQGGRLVRGVWEGGRAGNAGVRRCMSTYMRMGRAPAAPPSEADNTARTRERGMAARPCRGFHACIRQLAYAGKAALAEHARVTPQQLVCGHARLARRGSHVCVPAGRSVAAAATHRAPCVSSAGCAAPPSRRHEAGGPH